MQREPTSLPIADQRIAEQETTLARAVYVELEQLYGDQVKLEVGDRSILNAYITEHAAALQRVAKNPRELVSLIVHGYLHEYCPEVVLLEDELAVDIVDELIEEYGLELIVSAVYTIVSARNLAGQHDVIQSVSVLTFLAQPDPSQTFKTTVSDLGGENVIIPRVKTVLSTLQPSISALELKRAVAKLVVSE